MNVYFIEDDTHMANKYVKRWLFDETVEKCKLGPQWEIFSHPFPIGKKWEDLFMFYWKEYKLMQPL